MIRSAKKVQDLDSNSNGESSEILLSKEGVDASKDELSEAVLPRKSQYLPVTLPNSPQNQKRFIGLETSKEGLIKEPLAKVLLAAFENNDYVIIGDGNHFSSIIQNSITLATEEFAKKYAGTRSAISLELRQEHQAKIDEALSKGIFYTYGVAHEMLRNTFGADFKINLIDKRLRNALGKVGVIAHDSNRKGSDGEYLPDVEVNRKWVETIAKVSKEKGYDRLLIVGGALHTVNATNRSGEVEKKDLDELFEDAVQKKPFYIHFVSDAKLTPAVVPGKSDIYIEFSGNFNNAKDINDVPDLLVSFGGVSNIQRFNEINQSDRLIERRSKDQVVINTLCDKLETVNLSLLISPENTLKIGIREINKVSHFLQDHELGLAQNKLVEVSGEMEKIFSQVIESRTKESKSETEIESIKILEKEFNAIGETLTKIVRDIDKLISDK